ncbi:MAG: riboflavin biosynthesis protein RibA [Lysobacteraceae bacterium]|nr:MAG: riboflavin biosynthesis protein RibA [Xanthomonadaceae bacterium]
MADLFRISGEASNHKVAAIFPSADAASAAAARVRQALGLADAQVQVLRPGEKSAGVKLEPESHGIFRTMLRAHAKLGVLGAVLGMVAFAVMYAMGIPMIVQSAVAAFLVLLFFGAVAGLFLGGLFTLRPDQDRYVHSVLSALAQGQSAVVVHAFDAEQRARAETLLQQEGEQTVASL